MPTYFDIRAEFSDNRHLDIKVAGNDLNEVKPKAEAELRRMVNLPFEAKFDWRGAVVFVDRHRSF